MRTVRLAKGNPRVRGRHAYLDAESYLVLPGCVRPFMAELRAKEQAKETVLILSTLPRWRRLFHLRRLFVLHRFSLQRRLGRPAARRRAWVIIAKTFLARRLRG